MDGVQLPQCYRAATRRRQFTFLPLSSQKFLVLIQDHVLKIQKTWFNKFMCNLTLIHNWSLVLCDSDCSRMLLFQDCQSFNPSRLDFCYKILFAIKWPVISNYFFLFEKKGFVLEVSRFLFFVKSTNFKISDVTICIAT